MKKIYFLSLVLLLMLVGIANRSFANNMVRISEHTCRFFIDIPEGWDSIPASVIKEKLGIMPMSLALYPKIQSSYFAENYIFVSVLPSVKALSKYKFNDIVENVKKMNLVSREMLPDSLKKEYGKIYHYVADGHFHICTEMKIQKDSIAVLCIQDLLLTKFGYISVCCYANSGKAIMAPHDMVRLISRNITVDSDYQYSEPDNPSIFTLRNIGMSASIGLVVFVVISLFGKKKKTDNPHSC